MHYNISQNFGSFIPAHVLLEFLCVFEPGVFGDVAGGYPLVLEGEGAADEVLGVVGDVGPVDVEQRVVAVLGHVLDLLQEVRLEGQLARQHEVEDDAQAEDVDLLVVRHLLVDLRSDEARSPRELLPRGEVVHLVLVDGKPEVDQLHPLYHLLLVVHHDLH
jgi:hypothetical protein